MNLKIVTSLFFSIVLSMVLCSQVDNNISTDGFVIFYGEDSLKISEGTMRNGKPDGYWKNYYLNGNIRNKNKARYKRAR